MNSLTHSNQVLAVEFLRGESLTLQSVGQNASESMVGESMYVIRKALDALVEAILGFHEDGSVKGTHEWMPTSEYALRVCVSPFVVEGRLCVCVCV